MKFCVKGMEEGGHVVILVFLDDGGAYGDAAERYFYF